MVWYRLSSSWCVVHEQTQITMLYNCSHKSNFSPTQYIHGKSAKESQWYTASTRAEYHTTRVLPVLPSARASWVIAYKAHGRMTGRGSGRHASSAGGHELLDARALLREEGRRRVRVEVPREEAVDKLGLLLFNELALFVVALGREQQPALAPRQRDLPRIATKLGVQVSR